MSEKVFQTTIINPIIRTIKQYTISLNSIIVYGSYSRNEGVLFHRDGRSELYNDIDILIIAKGLSDKQEAIIDEIKKVTHTQWADLTAINLNELKLLKKKIQKTMTFGTVDGLYMVIKI